MGEKSPGAVAAWEPVSDLSESSLSLELGKQSNIEVKRLRVCQGVPVCDRPIVHDVRHRNFDLLHVESIWNIRDFKNQRGNVLRGGLLTESFPNLLLQPFRKLMVRG